MKRMGWLAMVLALSACGTLHVPGSSDRYWLKSENAIGMNDAVSLLHYASYARNLSAAEREREGERQRSAYVRDKSDFRRLQYALLLLSIPDAGTTERRQAQQLIEPLLEGRHDPELAALGALLNSQIVAWQQTQKRGDELERKLDAVKDIERSLLRREKGKL